jgi:hypothetical protein
MLKPDRANSPARKYTLSPDMTASPSTMGSTGAPPPNWEANYGKSFRLATTPQDAVEGGATPGTVSLITPYNQDAWNNWKDAPAEATTNFKNNWSDIWHNTGGYKQRQVLGAMNND